ncbi:hypothetical protein F4777DRAFT_409985 [Nemania sp. FL0916]|nr:hypothetical protein F4777DRAFT_409985 [Nemania sp. FL0916]
MPSYLNWGLDNPQARSWVLWAIASLILYIPLCNAIRRHQRRRLTRKHGPLEKMTLEEAYAIKSWMAEHEFPRVFSAAMSLVFFTSEGIPSVARPVAGVLKRALQFSSPSSSSPSSKDPATPQPKPRTCPPLTPADLLGPPGSSPTLAAIARVNHVHGIYKPSGPDLLYTLSICVLLPQRWIARFEPRHVTLEERHALATLWRAIGEELRVPYELLPSYDGKEGGGFRDALHWLEELETWAKEYERRNREMSSEGVFLGEKEVEMMLKGVPKIFKRVARGCLAALIDPELRVVKRIEPPSKMTAAVVEAVIVVRKVIRKYFCSPVALVKGYRRSS